MVFVRSALERGVGKRCRAARHFRILPRISVESRRARRFEKPQTGRIITTDSIEHLRELFIYNDWANRRVINALKSVESESSRRILAHLLITEREYYERLYGKGSFGFEFWQNLSLEECGGLARENAERFEKLLRKFDDEGLDLKTSYRTSEGVWCENTFRELLTHVLFHSSIHRGNSISKLREENHPPPQIDYIIYLRETG